MRYLMSTGRTYACVYNIQGWCCYVTLTHACYAQDFAPRTPIYDSVLEYRDLEVKLYRALDSPLRSASMFEKLAGLLAAKKKEVLDDTGAQNLAACAFRLYLGKGPVLGTLPAPRGTPIKPIINREDPNIPRLLSAEQLSLRGDARGAK